MILAIARKSAYIGLLFVSGAVCVLLLFAVLPAFLTGAFAQSSAPPAARAYTQHSVLSPQFLVPHPSSPTTSIHCASASGGSTGAPCPNPTAYTTSQAATNATSDGDEIRIANGSYTAADQQSNYSPPVAVGETGSTQYIYNLDQQLTQIIQPGNVTITIGYDSAGRPSTLTHPLGSVTTAYAPVTSNLSQIGCSDGVTITYGYDGSLLTDTTWSGVISGTVHHTYNNDFNISSETVNGANQVNYSHDQDGLLSQVGALVASRNAQSGLLTGTALGSVTDTIGYNQFGEALTYTAAYNGANLLLQANARDNAGRIAQRIEAVSGITHTFAYTYDLAQRLTDVARDGVLVSHYSYSLNDNRTSYIGPNGTITGTYDTQDRLLQYGNLTFTYSPNGELQSKTDTSTSQTTAYVYDALSNLRTVTLPGGSQISYVIDGQNRRVGKKVNGTLVQGFLYSNAPEPVAELDSSGNVVARFVYGTQGNAPDYMVRAGQTYFIISDNLGSPRLVVNVANGQIAQRMDYDEFGNVTLDTNPGFQLFGFAGGIYDRDTGLVRFGARDYDPFTGRWTSKDPILFGGGSTNLYGYIINDPVNGVDPSGLVSGWDVWNVVSASPLKVLMDVTVDKLAASDEEIRQRIEQERKQERELIDQFNNKQFGPFSSPKQAGFALWLMMSQVPSDLREDVSYSCEVQLTNGVSEYSGRRQYKYDGTIPYPDITDWDAIKEQQPRIFVEIHVSSWKLRR